MNDYSLPSPGAKNQQSAPNFDLQLKRWISENRDLVKRLVAKSGGDSPQRASKDFLKKWAGTWQRGLWYWSLGERPGAEWWVDDPIADSDAELDAIEGAQE